MSNHQERMENSMFGKITEKLFVLLVVFGLSISFAPGRVTPIKAEESTPILYRTEEELSYEEYVKGVAANENISYEEAEAQIRKNDETRMVPYSYQKKYSRFSQSYSATNGELVSQSYSYGVHLGVYATYYVDSSNWQLRYFSSIDNIFVEINNGVQSLTVYNKTAQIIDPIKISYHAQYFVTTAFSPSGHLYTKDIVFEI